MKLNVFGLGYVGNVTALCLTKLGHEITGVEVVLEKVCAIEKGKLPIFEPGLDDLLRAANKGDLAGKFRVMTKIGLDHFACSEGSIICVGTPSLNSGDVDLSQIQETLETIARALKQTNSWHNVIVRSTIPPGTMQEILIPLLEEASGKKAGEDFGVGFYPEFLREGKSINDFSHPSLNILGCTDEKTFKFVEALFAVKQPLRRVDFRTAETIKYVNNSYHGLKVAFANEIGALCKVYDINVDELVDIFLSDTKLNISAHYLRPGFAFGGACLPKELRATSALLLKKGLKGPLISSITSSNDEHINRFVSLVQESGVHSIAFFGVTFKADTDDIRESALLRAMAILLELPTYKEKLKITVCDQARVMDKIKKEYLSDQIKCESHPEKVMKSVEMIILGPYRLDGKASDALRDFTGIIVDLKWFTVSDEIKEMPNYQSFC